MFEKLISTRIDPQIYQTAREMGVNISKTCKNSDDIIIARLTKVVNESEVYD